MSTSIERGLFFLIFLIVISAVGCGETQQTDLSLYEAKLAPAPSGTESKTHVKEVLFGPDGYEVPVSITYNAQLSEGCWKITDVKVERKGGSPNVVIGGVRHNLSPCALDLEPGDGIGFESLTIFMDYHARPFIKTYESRNFPFIVRGDGKPVLTR